MMSYNSICCLKIENKDNTTSVRDLDTTKKKNKIDETDDIIESLLRLPFLLSSTYAALSSLLDSSNFQTAREEEEKDGSHDNDDKGITVSNIKDDDDVAVCKTDLVPVRDI